MAISLRLRTLLEYVKNTNVLADIGTDHAYLPIEACKLSLCKTAIACDINKGPLEIAKKNIEVAGLTACIQTRLGDGLAPLNSNEADTIVISGMGGMAVWRILQNPRAKEAKKLILQPQHNIPELRINLHQAGFNISEESLIKEDGRFYIILIAAYGGEIATYSPQEYFLGKGINNSDAYGSYLNHTEEKILKYIDFLSDTEKENAMHQLEMLHNCKILEHLPHKT